MRLDINADAMPDTRLCRVVDPGIYKEVGIGKLDP